MFPSSGYFKGINCPYFNSGLCERPYCHFRHIKSSSTAHSPLSVTFPTATSGQLTFSKDEKKGCDEKQSVAVEYRPTPIHLLKSITPSSDSEYDPVKNYSSVVRCNASVKRYSDSPVDSTSAKKAKLQSYDSATESSTSNDHQGIPVQVNESNVAAAVTCRSSDNDSTATEQSILDEVDTVIDKSSEQVRSTSFDYVSNHAIENHQSRSDVKSAVVTHNGIEKRKIVSSKQESVKLKPTESSKNLPAKEQSGKLKPTDSAKHLPPKEESIKIKSTGSSKSLPDKRESAKLKTSDSSKHVSAKEVSAKLKPADSSKRLPTNEESAKSVHAKLDKLENKSAHVHEIKDVEKKSKDSKLSSNSKRDSSAHNHERHRDGTSRSHSKQSGSDREQLHVSKKPSGSYNKYSSSTGVNHQDSSHGTTKRLADVASTKQNQSTVSTTKSVTRVISTVELFGEDSDTENIDAESEKQHQGIVSPSPQHHMSVVSSPAQRNTGFISPSPHRHANVVSLPPSRPSGIPSTSPHMSISSTSADDVNLLSFDDSSGSGDSAVDVFEECQQIYSDFTRHHSRSNNSTKGQSASGTEAAGKTYATEDASISCKKRLAHISSSGSVPLKRLDASSKRHHNTPAQQMLSRIEALKKSQAAKCDLPVATSNVKRDVPVSTSKSVSHKDTLTSSAVASTSQGKRVAHVPVKIDLKRPTLAPDSSSKIPINVRQSYLNRFFDDCVKIYDNGKDATERAFTEEKSVFDRSSMKSVYVNLAIHTIRRLRDEIPGGNQLITSPNVNPLTMSHEAVLGGAKATCTSYTVKRSGRLPSVPDKLTDSELYQRLKKYLLTDVQLIENGYPRQDFNCPGTVTIKVSEMEKNYVPLSSANSNEKICSRCGKRFIILPDGSIPVQEQCVYHWGKAWKKRIAGSVDNSYTCCQGDLNTKGCSISACHVHERNKYSSLSGYMKTLSSSSSNCDTYGVFALDCEMIYTTEGSELARVTVVNSNLEIVLETMVRPEHPILDYNTRFSGITKESLKSVKTTLRDVQAKLLSIFNDKSILIGHSLESDFIALKLIHSTVVDTSVVFPHRLGQPYKRALRNLAAEILQRIIQNDVAGHDSAEDARTCMELMTWRLKEDLKKELRR